MTKKKASVASLEQNPVAHNAQSEAAMPPTASREELIRQRAYALYESRTGEDGVALDDWLLAEKSVDLELESSLQAS